MIHDLSSPSNCDSELQVKLEKFGWIMSEHDVERCACINLDYLGMYKFIKNVPVSYKKHTCETIPGQSNLRFCMSKSRLCYAMNDARSISIIHLTTQEKLETINMDLYMEEDGAFPLDNALQSIDNTLVFLENDLCTGLKKIHLWNLKKAEYVTELNVLGKVKIGNNFDVANVRSIFDIDHVNLAKNKLLVMLHIFDDDRVCQFLMWNLDTEDPSTSNLTHSISFEHYYHYYDVEKVYINSKFFCYTSTSHYGGLELRIFHFDDLPKFKTKALNEKYGWEAWNCFEVQLESEDSGRLAIYDKISKKARVYNLDNYDVNVEFQVDFSSIQNKISSTILMSGFFMDNIIFVNIDYEENELNFIIVTEMGDVVEGKKQNIKHSVNEDAFFYFDNFGMIMERVKMEAVHAQETPFKQIHLYHM